jgi:endonuclease/exonuclease/phosphatase family metal-dependent hydrolase
MAMPLRVATFNVENLDEVPPRGLDFADRIHALRPLLLRLDADVLCLQEVNARHPTKHAPRTLGGLDRLLDGTPYASFTRVATERDGGGFLDVHNLVVLSRLPVRAHAQHWHDAVAPPLVALRGAGVGARPASWDRPVLEVTLDLPDGRALHVFDAHLRAPLAARIEGEKLSATSWRTTSGWAEGYFVAAVKRTGQALELRLHVDRLLDADARALILVAGDLNADLVESPLRILCAEPDDTGNPALAGRRLIPLETRGPDPPPATSVIHKGRRLLLDHLLASPALAETHLATHVLSDGLADEALAVSPPPGSFHAPLVVELAL